MQCADRSFKFEIETIEVDKDHIHFIIDYSTNKIIKNIVNQLKSFTTCHIWNNHESELSKQF